MKPRLLLLVVLLTIAGVGATDHAGGWNDGSRLAAIESLVDRGTWCIDDSVFLTPRPYAPAADQFPRGTLDRMMIDGHYYSDKSPLPAVLLAGPYWLWRQAGGPSAAERPDLFCRGMTLCSSGFAFCVTGLLLMSLGQRVGHSASVAAVIAGIISMSTLALPYSRSVNNHIVLAALVAGLLVSLDSHRWLLSGLLAGLCYSTDLGAGPAIVLGTLAYAVCVIPNLEQQLKLGRIRWIARSIGAGAVGLSVPVVLHHVLNFSVAGTWGPANAHPEFFHWPGCPFDAATLSGGWSHRTPIHFLGYSIDLLAGKKGFYGHNPGLLLVLPAIPIMLGSSLGRLCLSWMAGVWLVYAAGSKNASGLCISVRWYVPLVVPAAWGVLTLLNQRPEYTKPFLALSAIGLLMNSAAWWLGPWSAKVPFFWVGYVGSLVLFVGLRPRNRKSPVKVMARAA
ncbi:MAG: hypothetical protein K1X57_01305 [Gemmataceae bacterium]|nr:hypothetical protein [Gemmataceae bacterium]